MAVRDFENIDASASNFILSACIMADSFFCGIIQKDESEPLAIHHLKAHFSFLNIDFSDTNFVESVKNHPLWQHTFSKISILSFTDKNMTLPLGVDSRIVGSVPMFDFQQVYVEKVINQDLATYFGFSQGQQLAIASVFEGKMYEVHHFPSVLSSFFIGQADTFFHIHIENKRCYIYGQKDHKMTFYNSYEMIDDTDLLYHLINTMQESGLPPLDTTVTISGWVEPDSPLFKLLKSYVPNINFMNLGDQALLGTQIEGYKLHHYFAHFAHALCV